MSLAVRLTHRFPGFDLDVTFDAPGGVTALFGQSGSGKTTVVNAIAGLMKPEYGRIEGDGMPLLDTGRGIDVPRHRRRIGYVFQDARLFPHLSVRQNLMFGRWFTRERRSDPDHVLRLLGIGHLLARKTAGLSGGERQRVAIGRALLAEPRMLLMDEPLAALDAPRKAEILPYLERLAAEARIPILYVSHDVSEIARLAHTVVTMEAGRVIQVGPAREVLSDPAAVPALGLRDAGAVLEARVVGHDDADALTELAVSAGSIWLPRVGANIGTVTRVRIKAHDIVIARSPPEGLSALNVLPARIAEIRKGTGPGAAVVLIAGADRLLARVTRRAVRELELAEGAECYAVFKAIAIARADVAPGASGQPHEQKRANARTGPRLA